MPIFEFICSACDEEFEEIVSSAKEKVPCPKCGGRKVKRKPSAFAIKTSGRFVSSRGGSCSGCSPGPGGCSSCGH
ncbi:MAG: zinc ribbon domain-containing protein [Deltaproteobacteria bacterium]|nr:zinc ribbon domain-containing protein [Deltaproteobacteria bacterium]